MQESMMSELTTMHKAFFRILAQAGATFNPSPKLLAGPSTGEFVCHCGRSFTTPQGLACHRRHSHGERAAEHTLIDSATCPECLRFFWTKQRLYQHLSYISRKRGINSCFQALNKRGYVTDPESGGYCQFPVAVKGLGRVETIQASGPLQPLCDITGQQLAATDIELEQIDCELRIDQAPLDIDSSRLFLRNFLREVTLDWFAEFCHAGYDSDLAHHLPDRWLACLFQFDEGLDLWIEEELLSWGQSCLPDILDSLLDGEAEHLIDNAFADLAADLPRQQLLNRRAFLQAQRNRLDFAQGQDIPHRPARYGSANARERAQTAAHVPSAFEEQKVMMADTSCAKWQDLPEEQKLPYLLQPAGRRLFLIAHLFSGRRRIGDVHERLHFWAASKGMEVLVLSLDTANSLEYGNLHHHSVTWTRLLELYQGGYIAATLTGAPCETWSAARHNQVTADGSEEHGGRKHFPRPLRDADRIFGRQLLSLKELRQLQQGSLFFMQALITFGWSLVTGALYLSEHPAIPLLQEAASIWKTPWVRLLCQHPDVVLHTVAQWRWGCTVSKPTGLLSLRLPRFRQSMFGRQDPNAKPPSDTAIGLGADGRFKTSAHKEYPPYFCDALAGTIIDELYSKGLKAECRACTDPAPHLLSWLREASFHCSVVRRQAWLPDYQGH